MEQLKLAALDLEDLAVVSAHVQDAVLSVGDIRFLPRENTAVLVMNRFVWTSGKDKRTGQYERRRAALSVHRVQSMRSSNIEQSDKAQVLELLAVTFDTGEDPAGTLTLTFAGGGVMALDVECIEVQLADLGAAWGTNNKPTHFLG
ncbi:DUF2948 family protein [Roseibium sp.]|uniref:DUF2948 family protein n=1 Tax=Roseibium sp. TaxID=1936156 RepID=UPI003A98509F